MTILKSNSIKLLRLQYQHCLCECVHESFVNVLKQAEVRINSRYFYWTKLEQLIASHGSITRVNK